MNARQFVDFWSKYYSDQVKDETDYFPELNISNDLTKENVRKLLRWKDAYRFTDPIRSGPNAGKSNPKVAKVLACRGDINHFRNSPSTENDIRHTAEEMFKSGIVMRAFVLHISKPHTYPIADQHVFRAWSLHTRKKEDQTWDTYEAYCNYFGQITEALRVTRTSENIRELKRIDTALLAFGQFLNTYYREEHATRS